MAEMAAERQHQTTKAGPILRVVGLTKTFRHRGAESTSGPPRRPALAAVSLDIRAGECFGLVGESGSGKTTLGRCIVRLVPADSGEVVYGGVDLLRLSERRFRPYRSKLQMIFQNPAQALNPRQRVGPCLAEPLRVHRTCAKTEVAARVQELLALVGLDADLTSRFPHELSGGQRQRVAIARALATRPDFLVADEPTSSLDAPRKRQIIELLTDLRKKFGLTMLLISHDLGMVAQAADRIGVLHRGVLVEVAPTASILRSAAHPYTRLLLECGRRRQDPDGLYEWGDPGTALPSLPEVKAHGCEYVPDCPWADAICAQKKPPLKPIAAQHAVACHLVEGNSTDGQANELPDRVHIVDSEKWYAQS